MIIDYHTLSNEALKGIAEQFVLSQLSEAEDQLRVSEWVTQAINKVKSGELVVAFSEVDESVTLMRHSEIKLGTEQT